MRIELKSACPRLRIRRVFLYTFRLGCLVQDVRTVLVQTYLVVLEHLHSFTPLDIFQKISKVSAGRTL
jgi:hypothetical protein